MDYKDTLERINYFEELLPINQMELLGVNIWPILRLYYVANKNNNQPFKAKRSLKFLILT